MLESFRRLEKVNFFITPIPIIAVFVMALNDHFLKAQYHNGLTGKLSDVMGLFFFPLYLAALYIIFQNFVLKKDSGLSRPLLLSTILISTTIFSLVNLFSDVASYYQWLMGSIGFPSKVTLDSTDLLVLPVCLLTYVFGIQFIKESSG